jgi:imidazolonepropionase-like amidohydrolase
MGVGKDARVPAGAKRISVAGKTLMPMIVDTHVHLSTTREGLERDLKRRAYYGVGAAMSLGTDGYELLGVRGETIPGAARFRSAGRGITMQEPGRTTVPYWVNSPAEGRKAVEELAARKVDIVKIWVDTRDGKFKKLTPEIYGAIIDEAHKRGLRVTAHIFEGADPRGGGCAGARRARPRRRRRAGGDVQAASESGTDAEPAAARGQGRSRLARAEPRAQRARRGRGGQY